MIALAPEWVQALLRAEVPVQYQTEASGQIQLPRSHHRAQTTFLEKSAKEKDDDRE